MKESEMTIEELKARAEKYRAMLHIGECTYEEARKNVDPYIKAVNEKAKEIAKKYNRKAPKMTAMAFLR